MFLGEDFGLVGHDMASECGIMKSLANGLVMCSMDTVGSIRQIPTGQLCPNYIDDTTVS